MSSVCTQVLDQKALALEGSLVRLVCMYMT